MHGTLREFFYPNVMSLLFTFPSFQSRTEHFIFKRSQKKQTNVLFSQTHVALYLQLLLTEKNTLGECLKSDGLEQLILNMFRRDLIFFELSDTFHLALL